MKNGLLSTLAMVAVSFFLMMLARTRIEDLVSLAVFSIGMFRLALWGA